MWITNESTCICWNMIRILSVNSLDEPWSWSLLSTDLMNVKCKFVRINEWVFQQVCCSGSFFLVCSVWSCLNRWWFLFLGTGNCPFVPPRNTIYWKFNEKHVVRVFRQKIVSDLVRFRPKVRFKQNGFRFLKFIFFKQYKLCVSHRKFLLQTF